jgi:TolB protein
MNSPLGNHSLFPGVPDMKPFLLAGLTLLGLGMAMVASRSESNLPGEPVSSSTETLRAFGPMHPRISPDGKQIVFSYQGAIWRMPSTGGTMTRLTEGSGFDIDPVWSPDEKRIAYLNSRNMAGGQLKLINAQTGAEVILPKPVSVVGTIAYQKIYFHPDGQRILGMLRAAGENKGLAFYNLTTGEVKSVVTLPRWSRYALSHDGKTIIYTATMNVTGQQGGNDGPQADLWKVSSAGGKPVKLTRFPARIHDLCFAADDHSLFVVTELGGVHNDVWSFRLDDPLRSARKLTMGQADEDRPSVSRDGRWLLYTNNQENATSLILRDLSSSEERTVTVSNMNFQKPTGLFKLNTLDRKTGQPMTARISIEDAAGKYHAPAGSLYRVLNNYGHFYCEKQAELSLPVGKYRLRALRGPEYRPLYKDFSIENGKTTELVAELNRWIHQAERGWYSGENHIHANYGYGEWYNTPQTMLQQCAGENLNVCNFMVANSDSNGVFDREFFRGRPDPLSTGETLLYWNQEFRSTIWGHMTLVNLKQVVEPVYTGFKDTTNPWDIPTNSDIADRTHLQKGHVNYTHVAQNPNDPYQNPYTGKGIPVDVALGKIDSLDLNASYNGTVPLWYRLLNCGFRLPASAGTDCFLNRVRSRLPGGDRVYVQVDGNFTYGKWIDGLQAGKSFVTNGPMLELSINGKQIGETVKLTTASEISIKGQATAQFPLNRVELVYNGKVVATGRVSQDKLQSVIDEKLKIDTSGWIALRASGLGHADHPIGTQYAHSNPVYIQVGDQPTRSKEDAEFFLKWIDRLSLAIRVRDRIPSEELKQHVRNQFESARDVYRKIAER